MLPSRPTHEPRMVDCDTCSGDGWVSVGAFFPGDPEADRPGKCDDCDGMGLVETEWECADSCPACEAHRKAGHDSWDVSDPVPMVTP